MKTIYTTAFCLLISFTCFGQTFTNYTTTEGLASNNVSSLVAGQNTDMWFGTTTGISVFDGTNWTTYDTGNSGLVDNNILSIYMDNTGRLWAGTDFGVSVLDGSNWLTYTTADGMENNKVQCIGEDADGDIWFGSNTGLSEFNGTSWNTYGSTEGIPFGGINSITLNTNDDLWLGGGLGGVVVYDGATFSFITTTEGLISNKIRSVAISDQGKKWVATADGLTRLGSNDDFEANYTRIYSLPAPDTLNPIEDVKIDGNGILWAGVYVDYLVTEGGVCAFDGTYWSEFDVNDGLVGPVIRALEIDANDAVWVATSSGVSKIDNHTVGIARPEGTVEFKVYPNPAKDWITIQTQANNNTMQQIEVYNSSMQIVASEQLFAGENQKSLQVSNLASGLYFIKVGTELSKFIVN